MGWSGDGTTVRGTATIITVEVVCPELDLELSLPVAVQVSENATTNKLVAAALADMAAAISAGGLLDHHQSHDPLARLEKLRYLQGSQAIGVKKVPVRMLCENCRKQSPHNPVGANRLSAADRRGTAVATQTELLIDTTMADEEASCQSDEHASRVDPGPRQFRRTVSSTTAAQLSLQSPCTPSRNMMWKVSTGASAGSFGFGSASPVSNGIDSPTRGRQLITPKSGGVLHTKTTPTSDDRCTLGESSRGTSSRATTIGSAPLGIDSVGPSSVSDSGSGSEMEFTTEITISGSCRSDQQRTPSSRQNVAPDHVRERRRRRRPSKRITSSQLADTTPLESSLLSTLDNAIVDRIASERAEVLSATTRGLASPSSSMPLLDSTSALHSSESARLPPKVAATFAAIDARGDGKERLSFSLDSAVRRRSFDRRDSFKNSARSGGRSSDLPLGVLMQHTFSPDFPEALPPRLMAPKRRQSVAGSSCVNSNALSMASDTGFRSLAAASTGMPPRLPSGAPLSISLAGMPSLATEVQAMQARRRHSPL